MPLYYKGIVPLLALLQDEVQPDEHPPAPLLQLLPHLPPPAQPDWGWGRGTGWGQGLVMVG